MSFLDKAKAQMQAANEKRAEKHELQGKKLAMLPVEYTGGYESYKKAQGILTFYENVTEFKAPLMTSFTIANKGIVDTAVEGRQDVSRRVTVTRLLAFGIFAFGMQKKNENKEAFITLVLANTQEAIFYVKNTSPMDLKRKLGAALTRVQQGVAPTDQTTAPTSVADELTKLAELKKQGLLTDAEYNVQKKRLLN